MKGVSYGSYHFENNGWMLITPEGFRDQQISGVYLGGGASPPLFAGVQRSPRILRFLLVPLPGEWGTHETRYRNLERDCLRSDLPIERALVIEFDTGEQATMQARLRNQRQGAYELIFEAADEYHYSDDASTSVTGPSVAGNDLTIDVQTGGTARTRPVLIAEYAKAKTSQTYYALPYTVEETAGEALSDYPHTITIDHAALVTASKSLSSGNDLLVFVNGTEVARAVTDPNTATTDITFPLSLDPLESADVEIRYAPAGQTYGLGSTFKSVDTYVITNEIASNVSDLPYKVTFDHAAFVTATRSEVDGDDIRVFIDGEEVDRVVYDPNTATTDVWFPLAVLASGTVLVELRMGGGDFSGTTYSNGSMDLSASTNTNWVYTTPDVDTTSDDTPGLIKALLMRVNASFSLPASYYADADTIGGEPSIRTAIDDVGGGGVGFVNGNYIRFYAGGLRITHVNTAVTREFDDGDGIGRIADSPDGSTYTPRHQFTGTSQQTSNYAARALASGTKYVVLGAEKNSSTGIIGPNLYAHWHGQSTSELSITLHSDDDPSSAAYTAPTNTAGSEGFVVNVDATITDELNHTLTIRGLSLTEGQQIKIDCVNRRISLLDSSDAEISGSRASARDTLTISSADNDWLACEPNTTTTFTWAEDDLDADGLKLTLEVADAWR